jgi:hypothetical protein
MSPRRIWLAGAAVAIAAVIGLLVAALQSTAVRTQALDAPNQYQVALLQPSTHVCEGPVSSQEPFRSVGIWGSAVTKRATLTVHAQDASTRRTLTTGQLAAFPLEGEWQIRLARELPANVPVRICLTGEAGTFTLVGSPAVHPNVVMTGRVTGRASPQPNDEEFSLVLLSDGHQSLLSSLPLAFSRASLWRPSWVGSWTFWVLAAALVAGFGLAVLAVVRAAASDDGHDAGGDDHEEESGPAPPSDSGTREASRAAAYR